ncbi:MAG TPA: 50S ribosomal protein L25 [Thermoanaerobaculia bacterium]|nr:50S ribosomal protein L25 [Thermoanaerobaculia bacterium]
MSELTIEVQQRGEAGTGASRRLRAEGKIPAVVYGLGRETLPIHIERKAFLDMLKESGSENPIFLLKLAGSGKERHAMIRDMQVDPISRQVIHIDFLRVSMTEKVRVSVPIELVGTAYGVKTEGGMLDFVTREVHVECLPGDIPKHLQLEVSELHIGQHREAGDLALPKGVALLDEPDRVIVAVAHAKIEAAPAAAEEVAAEEAPASAEPEVIKRGKPEES